MDFTGDLCHGYLFDLRISDQDCLQNSEETMNTLQAAPNFWRLTAAAAAHAVVSFFSPIINIWALIAKEPDRGSSSGERIEAEYLKF